MCSFRDSRIGINCLIKKINVMDAKKNPRYNLEKRRILFLQFGFLFSLLFVLMAFEYKIPVDDAEVLVTEVLEETDELVPVTFQEPKKKLEPPKIKKIELIDLIVIEEGSDFPDYDPEDSFGDPGEDVILRPIIEEDTKDEAETPFCIVEEMPIFNPRKNKTYEEGVKDLFYTMQKMVRYPVAAQEGRIEGKVFVKFVVTKTGEISNIQIVRKVDPLLDREVIRVVENLPKFKSGKQRNKPVDVWFSGYINFVLQ